MRAKSCGKSRAGYGVPGKTNTLINYCGIHADFLDYTVDCDPCKESKYLPGDHIAFFPLEGIFETTPDYVLILPWNFKDEIINQLADLRGWGVEFAVPISQVTVI